MHDAARKLGLYSESAWEGSGRRKTRVMAVGQKADVEEIIAEIDERSGRGRKDPMHYFQMK